LGILATRDDSNKGRRGKTTPFAPHHKLNPWIKPNPYLANIGSQTKEDDVILEVFRTVWRRIKIDYSFGPRSFLTNAALG
jgi:hypothetical protein